MTTKNKFNIGTLILAMLLVGMVLIPVVSAQQEENNYNVPVEKTSVETSNLSLDNLTTSERYLPDQGPSIFEKVNRDSNVIETRGVIPEIKDNKEKANRLDTLEASMRSSKDKLEPYMKENGGSLIGYGVNYEGYAFVEFDEKQKDNINKSTADKLYNVIKDDAEKMKLADIPVVFRKGEEMTPTARDSVWQNLIGGIQVRSYNALATLGFAAQDNSGNKGVVISGHFAQNAGGIGAPIYQPTTSRQIGTVTYYNFVFADAAWVKASNVADDVYYQDTNVLKDVYDYGDTTLGTKVYKSGIGNGLTSGNVDNTYIELYSSELGRYLEDQFTATYSSSAGDSGSPVFTLSGSTVKIVGIHWGHNSANSAFSPISGVIEDLNVRPLY